MIATILTISVYSFLTIFILFFLGYGITLLLTPNKLKSYAFWLSPWFSIFFLILFLVIFGFLGFSVKQISPVIIIALLILNALVFFKKKLKYELNLLQEILIGIIVIISVFFNCRPLITKAKSLTTISFGNNDVVTYAAVPDYLINHSIGENFFAKKDTSKPLDPVTQMISSNYRWSPIIVSFFLNIFKLQGYQFIYLFEVLLFALAIPLVYLLLKILYKDSIPCLILGLFLFTFNVNLLYILYHNFFGQIFFWGIEIFLLIFLFSYLSEKEIKSKDFLKYDFIIGLTLTALFYSYHESMIFIIAPLFLFFIFRLIVKTDLIYYLRNFIIIFFITASTSFISIINAVKIDFMQAYLIDPNQPIGWQLFRNKIPYANPFEALGFYSIHSFEPLPIVFAVILSLLVVFFIVRGVIKSKEKPLLISFLIVYLLFFYWTGISQHNFFTYNRALTYTLPLIIVIFIIGFAEILFKNDKKNKVISNISILLLIILILYSAKKLSGRFISEYISVTNDYISLKNIQNNKKFINEPLYVENEVDLSIPYWNDIWIHYFLNLNRFPIHQVIFETGKVEVPEKSLVLVHKPAAYIYAPRIILRDIIWENNFFKIGRLCNSDSCLINSKEDLSSISFGQTSFEDNLLLSGWSLKEPGSRWAEGKQSNLRLVVKNGEKSKIIIEALTLKEPQVVNISIDGEFAGSFSPSTQFKSYSVALINPVYKGIHTILFSYSNAYKPSEVSQTIDNRDLAVNFKQIRLE
ncbi:MAG: hypothetical protein WCT22_01010 [Patescibacteria group bacterium]